MTNPQNYSFLHLKSAKNYKKCFSVVQLLYICEKRIIYGYQFSELYAKSVMECPY